MANTSHIPNKITLSQEQTKTLENLQGDIDEAKNVIKELEEVGVDFGSVKAQLLQAEKQRERLLKVFGNR